MTGPFNPAGGQGSGDIIGTEADNTTVVAIRGTGLANPPVDKADLSKDGYALVWNHTTQQWSANSLNAASISGTFPTSSMPNLAGDTSGPFGATHVTAIQGNPVQALTLGAAQDGYALTWNQTNNQFRVAPFIQSQDPYIIEGDGVTDNSPQFQTWINAQVPTGIYQTSNHANILLVNCYLGTHVDYSPLFVSGAKIQIQGKLTYAVGVAEFDLPTNVHIVGVAGGGGGGGALAGAGAQAKLVGLGPSLNETHDGYMDGYQYRMFVFATREGSVLPAGVVGQTFTTTSSSGTGWNTTWRAIGTYLADNQYKTVRLVWTGTGSVPQNAVAAIHWSVSDGVTTYSGTQGFDQTPGPSGDPIFKVWNLAGVVPANAYKHWLALKNPANFMLGTKLHRIMGSDSTTSVYINAYSMLNKPTDTISSLSDGYTLPQSTINVLSTAGFAPNGTISVLTDLGIQTVSYNGITQTSLTGCLGGAGTMHTGNQVGGLLFPDYGIASTTANMSGTLALSSITVLSTAGFPASGTFFLSNSLGFQSIAYTSKDATHFLGCTGGSGTIAIGQAIHSLPNTSAGAASMTTYESIPAIRMAADCSVSNIYSSQLYGPFCVFDATEWESGYNYISNCSIYASYYASTALINDGIIYWHVRDCIFSGGYPTTVQPSSILVTTTNNTAGQNSGIGVINNIQIDGQAIRYTIDTFGTSSSGDLHVYNLITEPGSQEPGTVIPNTWVAMVTLDNAVTCITIEDSAPGDASGVNYSWMFESTVPAIPGYATYLSAKGVGSSSMLGPNLAPGADYFQAGTNLGNQGTDYQAYAFGLTDASLLGGGDDISPVITLPYTLSLPPLATVANWNALTGSMVISNVDGSGNPLIGPDFSSGKVLRLEGSTTGNKLLCSVNLVPAIGDTIMCFMRVMNISSVSSSFTFKCLANNVSLAFTTSSGPAFLYLDRAAKSVVGQWVDSCYMTQVRNCDGYISNFSFYAQTSPGDMLIDPESIVFLYIPASAGLGQMELNRMYRKLRRQIAGATTGDIAIPSRNGLSFGSVARVQGIINNQAPGFPGMIDVPNLSVNQTKVVGQQLLDIPDDTLGGATDGYVQQIINALRNHGLIYNGSFNPATANGALRWWNADQATFNAATGAVTAWTDLVVGDTFTAAGIAQPTLLANALNSRYAVLFDGVHNIMTNLIGTNKSQQYTVWMVFKFPGSNVSKTILDMDAGIVFLRTDGSGNVVQYAIGSNACAVTPVTGTWYIGQFLYNGASSAAQLNAGGGSLSGTGNPGAGQIQSPISLGATHGGANFCNIEIAAFGFFDPTASGYSAATILAGLKAKYNL